MIFDYEILLIILSEVDLQIKMMKLKIEIITQLTIEAEV